MQLDLSHYHDFLKPEFKNSKFGATIPREFLLKSHSDFLRAIQFFFTCEGRFDKVFQYHNSLLMHFIGKKPLNLPFISLEVLERWLTEYNGRKKKEILAFFIFI
jgi:hypothetical protein